jgi:uracil-DNA glycosylase
MSPVVYREIIPIVMNDSLQVAKRLLGDEWGRRLHKEFDKPYMAEISRIVAAERKQFKVNPDPDKVFRAFNETPYDDVKVVIVGQDPYPNATQACGLAFSTDDESLPRSLANVFKEIEADVGFSDPCPDPDLSRWARQGVFLINTALTVRAGQSGSHSRIGWRTFVSAALAALNQKPHRCVFFLWGNHAQGFADSIDGQYHHVLTAAHPSPFSAHKGFFKCKHFSQANSLLKADGLTPIDW